MPVTGMRTCSDVRDSRDRLVAAVSTADMEPHLLSRYGESLGLAPLPAAISKQEIPIEPHDDDDAGAQHQPFARAHGFAYAS